MAASELGCNLFGCFIYVFRNGMEKYAVQVKEYEKNLFFSAVSI